MFRVVRSGQVTLQVVLVAWLLGACSSAPPAQPVARAATAPAAAEAPTCVDVKDQRVQCVADSDCCPRFVCGKDPDLSQSVNYCVFGG